MNKEELVRRFRSWLYRTHGFRGALSEKEARELLGGKLYDQLTEHEV